MQPALTSVYEVIETDNSILCRRFMPPLPTIRRREASCFQVVRPAGRPFVVRLLTPIARSAICPYLAEVFKET